MNHIADANKMVGETPRTDAECGDYDRSGCWKSYINGECVQSDFARQLERELNAATSEIERLRKANLQLREGAEEQKQRIKRLEEAGDALKASGYFGGFGDAVNKWIKVREDKP